MVIGGDSTVRSIGGNCFWISEDVTPRSKDPDQPHDESFSWSVADKRSAKVQATAVISDESAFAASMSRMRQ